ncbi:MAG TPA: HEAT repeat domain-containing protein, partial [Kofleriaceae bacterium]
ARIYRSLGQQPMVASAPLLLDGLEDPHPFARAQAARSLGWIAAPFAVDRLRGLAEADADPEVRRAAAQAAERICAFWVLYGAAAEQLVWDDEAGVPRAAYDALARDLAPYALTPPTAARDYAAYAREAEADETASLRDDPAREADDMRAIFAVSRQRRCEARAADLAAAPGALGWNARRALRALRLPG